VPGILGGGNAPVGELYVNGVAQKTGNQQILKAGDTFLCRIPGGGGLGDPGDRDPAAVARDLENNLISPEFADKHYGTKTRGTS
jgi:N-methylhydantoinase B/oxoprolinase/acetone carboxylase alpha subunit